MRASPSALLTWTPTSRRQKRAFQRLASTSSYVACNERMASKATLSSRDSLVFGSIGSCCIVCGCSVIASDSVQGSTMFDDDAIMSSDLLNKHDPGENRTPIALAAPSHTNMAVMSVTEKRNTLGQQLASAAHALAGHTGGTIGAIRIDERNNDKWARMSRLTMRRKPTCRLPRSLGCGCWM